MVNDKNNFNDMRETVNVSNFAQGEYSPEDETEYYCFSLQYPDGHIEYVKYSSPALYVRDIFTSIVAYQISQEYGCTNVVPCSLAEFVARAEREIESSESPVKILDEKNFLSAPEGFQLAVKYLNSAYFARDAKEMRLFLHKAMLQLRSLHEHFDWAAR
jgi:hypothetical protein